MSFRDRRGDLQIYTEANTPKQKIPYFQGTNLLGRNPAKTTLTIKDRSISEIHSKIVIKNNTIKIVDMNSKNGVYLNSLDNPIEPNVQVSIDPASDYVYFAQIRCRFLPDLGKLGDEDETREVGVRVAYGGKVGEVQREIKGILKVGNQEALKKEITTKQKNQQNVSSKDNKKTKKQEIDLIQKERQKQQLLKSILAEEEEIAKEQQRQAISIGQIEKKQEQEKPKKEGKKKVKKDSKQKSLQKRISKQQDKNTKKPNSKQKNKVAAEKQTSNNQNKKAAEKGEQNKQKQGQRVSKKQVTESTADRKGEVSQVSVELPKKQVKQKRAESGQTKVKGAHKKKNKSMGKLDQKDDKSKPLPGRKKLPDALSESLSEYPRRSIIQKTALISGFALSFKPSIKITITENWRQRFDVLVMEKYARTFKLLYSICLGVPVVTLNWIIESEYRRGIVPFQRFLLQAPEKDLIASSVAKAKSGFKVFKDLNFYLIQTQQSFHVPLQQIEALIEVGGGILKKQPPKKTKDTILITRLKPSSQDMKILKKIQSCDKIYTIQLILDSCLHQQIKWQENKVKKS